MRAIAQVMVNGIGENVSRKDGKTYRRAYLFVQGEDAGALEASLPQDSPTLVKTVTDQIGKMCTATLNLREFKGTLYVDLVALQPMGSK
jgi:hypothetical protein